MFAIRLEDIINDKDLVIPFEKLKMFNHQDVEVIILPRQRQSNTTKSSIMDVLSKYKGCTPFNNIHDSVEWQRKIRNEWE